MPATFGLDVLALIVSASATVPGGALQDTSSYDHSAASGGITAVALYPDCPSGFTLKTSTSNVYECTSIVPGNHAAATAYIAGQTDCKYPRYWNAGPQVTLTPVRDAALVRWVCQHL